MTSASQPHGPGSGAEISADGVYRYRLWRVWDSRPLLLWVMLNPSTADARLDDPTVRRCVGFSCNWGFGGIEVVNLFALRATDPREIAAAADPVGPGNDRVILRLAAAQQSGIVVAWGAQAGRYLDRVAAVWGLIGRSGAPAWCLGVTKGGHPRHPLMVRGDAARVAWSPRV